MMRQRAAVLGRTVLSCGAFAAFLLLLSSGPFVAEERPRRELPSQRDETVATAATSAATELTFSGLPVRLAESTTTPCNARTWDPFAAGYCQGRCTRLGEQREAGVATFAWREEESGELAALAVDCGTAAGPGRVSQLSILAAGLESFAIPRPGPRAPRTEPIPGLPGATEIARLQSGELTILLDRPRRASIALDELELALAAASWRRAGDPAAPSRAGTGAPATRVFVRGPELCAVALAVDGEEPLLISACRRDDPLPEASR